MLRKNVVSGSYNVIVVFMVIMLCATYVDLDGQVAKGVDPSLLVEPAPEEQPRKGYSSFTRVIVTTKPDGVRT